MNLFCPINTLSYGIVSYNILEQLSAKNMSVSLFPIGQITTDPSYDVSLIKKHTQDALFFDYKAPTLKIFHQNSLIEHISRPLLGFPIFELDRFTPAERHSLNYADKLLVCSKWAQGVIHKQLGKQASVIPLGVNSNIFKPRPSNETGIRDNNDQYIFLSVGKLEKRKLSHKLPELFKKAFPKETDVKLVTLGHNPFFSDKETEDFSRHYRNNRTQLVLNFIPSLEGMCSVMNTADCGLFPSRAEGWGLPILEMMACGKPVITTNYSGMTEYCTKENAHLVYIDTTEKAYDGKWFTGQGDWAVIDYDEEEQIIEYMRKCYRDRPSNQAGVETAKKFSWEHTVKKLLLELQ